MNLNFFRFVTFAMVVGFVGLGTVDVAFAKDGDRGEESSRDHDSDSGRDSDRGRGSDDDRDDDSDSDDSSGRDRDSGKRNESRAAPSAISTSAPASRAPASSVSVSRAASVPAMSARATQSNSIYGSSSSLNQNDARAAVLQGKARKLKDVISVVNSSSPGAIISVNLRNRGQNLVYEIKVLSANQSVKTVSVNARTLSIY